MQISHVQLFPLSYQSHCQVSARERERKKEKEREGEVTLGH
jgi:hypothetical protein